MQPSKYSLTSNPKVGQGACIGNKLSWSAAAKLWTSTVNGIAGTQLNLEIRKTQAKYDFNKNKYMIDVESK